MNQLYQRIYYCNILFVMGCAIISHVSLNAVNDVLHPLLTSINGGALCANKKTNAKLNYRCKAGFVVWWPGFAILF